MPEYATMIAGLEAGDLDFIARTQAKDVELIENTGNFNIFEGIGTATFHVTLNTRAAAF